MADPFADAERVDVTDLTDTSTILLRKSLRAQITARWAGVAQACGVPAGDHMLTLAIGAGGTVEGAKARGATAQPAACVSTALATVPLTVRDGSPAKLVAEHADHRAGDRHCRVGGSSWRITGTTSSNRTTMAVTLSSPPSDIARSKSQVALSSGSGEARTASRIV